MANRTNKQNRTFSRSYSVCSSSAPHRTEPNNTLIRLVFGRVSNIDILVRFVFGKFELLKAKSSTRYSLVSELCITGVISGLGSRIITMAEEQCRATMPSNNDRRTMVARTMSEEAGRWVFHKYNDIATSRIIKNSLISA
jgi:hypothetical protein